MGLTWVHFILKNKSGKEGVKYAEGRVKWNSCLFQEYGLADKHFLGISRESCSFSVVIRPVRNEEEGIFPPSR